MAEYFLHLRGDMDQTFDPEGVELPDMEAVKRTALKAAREILAHDVLGGTVNPEYRIEVANDQGEIVYVLRLGDAIRVVGH